MPEALLRVVQDYYYSDWSAEEREQGKHMQVWHHMKRCITPVGVLQLPCSICSCQTCSTLRDGHLSSMKSASHELTFGLASTAGHEVLQRVQEPARHEADPDGGQDSQRGQRRCLSKQKPR
jgi:hypothetical protein